MTSHSDQPRVLTVRTQGSDVSQVQGRLLDAGATIATEELTRSPVRAEYAQGRAGIPAEVAAPSHRDR